MNVPDKRLAALAAVEEVRPGMIVGLGTGSTAAFAIQTLGAKVRAGLAIRAVATSLATEALAHAAGIALIDLPARIDLTIDGADEIDADLRATKRPSAPPISFEFAGKNLENVGRLICRLISASSFLLEPRSVSP